RAGLCPRDVDRAGRQAADRLLHVRGRHASRAAEHCAQADTREIPGDRGARSRRLTPSRKESLVLTNRWDISHICVAVDDLEAAMSEYSAALGLEWSPIIEITPEFAAGMAEGGSTVEGLREVMSRNGATPDAWPTGAIQLASADPSVPAYASFACPDGKH